MSGRLMGKVALVTGAAHGQGRSHAVLAEHGADVVVLDLPGPMEPAYRYPLGTPEELAQTARMVEARWRIEPLDASHAVLFLASDEARYITGVQPPVDAGNTVKP
jgi:(+)-trans-carveol dehydrogenase